MYFSLTSQMKSLLQHGQPLDSYTELNLNPLKCMGLFNVINMELTRCPTTSFGICQIFKQKYCFKAMSPNMEILPIHPQYLYTLASRLHQLKSKGNASFTFL